MIVIKVGFGIFNISISSPATSSLFIDYVGCGYWVVAWAFVTCRSFEKCAGGNNKIKREEFFFLFNFVLLRPNGNVPKRYIVPFSKGRWKGCGGEFRNGVILRE